MSDIIADIDALIDEQLEAGEPLNGYDYDDPQHPKCPHCVRDWHGLAITVRIEQLRDDWQRAQSSGLGLSPLHCNCMWCQETFGQSDSITLEEATKALDEYRYATDDSEVICPGSDFIGPWATPWQLKKIREGWPIESPWSSLPLDPFMRRASFMRRTAPGFGDATGYLERLMTWTNPMFPTSYQDGLPVYDYRRGASITYSVVDRRPSPAQRAVSILEGLLDSYNDLFDPVPTEPRPWMWIPRERAFPAYTVEKTLRSRLWSAVWDTLGEHYELKITGTLPELVDATIETTGSIPWWATDVDAQIRMLDPSNRNRLIWGDRWGSRDFYLMPPRQNGLNWSTAAPATWQVSIGGQAPLNRRTAPLPPVTREREEPPMWALDATRRRRR
ncbi:hypothetical protein CH278_02045 [Rhodococcus sp. 05-2254-5]|uniref:hypothetical protein n=1 Tax=unclassified Rhodococcus (in: high G+C Gram-positive bacteria) TaxID=192944 RepID=UPI000B9A7711|nr:MULTISPECIES: hypothetical protein [unclassified Rhodococcus (in: high G+C Gram-positive bacteria)]OZE39088.1 hypothetical protein CH278_02045 [Rhodococcus sp. 05-2254-5]OZE59029.1 hypothetical protein CH269_08540 [Rhodococcus sp. 05-2254-1]